MPKRVQRKRKKGWRMPPNTVYVGRPTIHGNMFTIYNVLKERIQMDKQGIPYSASQSVRARCVEMYREEMLGRQMIDPAAFDKFLEPLRGKDLACFCPLDEPCHADVLLELANH